MTDLEFGEFIVAMRAEMVRGRQDPKLLRVARSKTKATIPFPDGTLFTIQRDHLEGLGTPVESAEVVYDVYLEDSRGEGLTWTEPMKL